jgi:predicted enzyme related to lactoylglutathione lyase
MHIQFAELAVFDQDRAKAFYIAHFDCDVAADVPMGSNGWRWIELRFGAAETTLHFLKRKDDTLSHEPVLVLVDDDIKTRVERLRSAGVPILSEPQRTPYDPNRIAAEFRDSEGNRIVLSQ